MQNALSPNSEVPIVSLKNYYPSVCIRECMCTTVCGDSFEELVLSIIDNTLLTPLSAYICIHHKYLALYSVCVFKCSHLHFWALFSDDLVNPRAFQHCALPVLSPRIFCGPSDLSPSPQSKVTLLPLHFVYSGPGAPHQQRLHILPPPPWNTVSVR